MQNLDDECIFVIFFLKTLKKETECLKVCLYILQLTKHCQIFFVLCLEFNVI